MQIPWKGSWLRQDQIILVCAMKNIVLFVHIHSSGFFAGSLAWLGFVHSMDARVYVQIANKDDVQKIPMKRTYFETV